MGLNGGRQNAAQAAQVRVPRADPRIRLPVQIHVLADIHRTAAVVAAHDCLN